MSTAANTSVGFAGSPPWSDVLAELLPRQGNWTDEQYLTLTDGARRLVEFNDGFLEVLPLPSDKHQTVLKHLFLAFDRFITPLGGTVLFAPLRLRTGPDRFREPDLVLLRSAADPRRQDRYWTGADLVLEVVSPDQPSRDYTGKRAEYAEAGITEYWIVDPEKEAITVLQLSGGAYADVGLFHRGQSAVSPSLTGFTVVVAAVFDRR